MAHQRGFTLVEVMVAAGLSGFILTAILGAFVMIGRSGYNAASYSVMEAEARRALETFSQEARLAKNIVWASTNSVTLTVVGSAGDYTVTATNPLGSVTSHARAAFAVAVAWSLIHQGNKGPR